jgi:hypothetical protein
MRLPCAAGPPTGTAARSRHPDDPDDPGRQRRLAWSILMRRTWGIDVLACRRCGGRMDLVAVIEDPSMCAKIL